MTRLPRLHLEHGIYYVVLQARAGQVLFLEDLERTKFLGLLAQALQRCDARLYAFCLLPERVHLAIHVNQIPVGRVVQHAAGQYSRWLRRRGSRGERALVGPLFEHGYRCVLLLNENLLPDLVRHIHGCPVHAGLASTPEDFVWSSHPVYLKRMKYAGLSTDAVLKQFAPTASAARLAYQKFMRSTAPSAEKQRFAPGSAQRARVLDDAQGGAARLAPALQPGCGPELNRLVLGVCELLRLSRAELVSSSRRRHLTLARALVAWRAKQQGIALAHVARYLERDPSSLQAALVRYSTLRPDLFTS